MKRTCKKTNEILEDHGDWLLVDISTNKFPNATMAVDKDIWENRVGGRVSAFGGEKDKYIYATYTNKKQIFFHNDVIATPDGKIADHINHGRMDFIDNRRSNLRCGTASENCMNQGIRLDNVSGIRGVMWNKAHEKWRSYISINGKQKHLGSFDNIDFAIGARKQAEKEYFGEFSPLNRGDV